MLKLSGVFSFELHEFRWPFRWRIFINTFLLTAFTLYTIASVVYSVKYLSDMETFKTFGYAFNNSLFAMLIHLHLLINRKGFNRMITTWEILIRTSTLLPLVGFTFYIQNGFFT